MITKIGRQTKILIIIVLLVVLATYAHGLTSIKIQKYTHDNNTGGGVFWHTLNRTSRCNTKYPIIKKSNDPISIQFMSHGIMSKKLRQYHQQYLFKFSPLEADLRKCPQKNKRLQHYQDSLLDFSRLEKKWLTDIVTKYTSDILVKFPEIHYYIGILLNSTVD